MAVGQRRLENLNVSVYRRDEWFGVHLFAVRKLTKMARLGSVNNAGERLRKF